MARRNKHGQKKRTWPEEMTFKRIQNNPAKPRPGGFRRGSAPRAEKGRNRRIADATTSRRCVACTRFDQLDRLGRESLAELVVAVFRVVKAVVLFWILQLSETSQGELQNFFQIRLNSTPGLRLPAMPTTGRASES